MANLLLGPNEVAALTVSVPAFVDDLPYVEYTAGRLFARQRTWYQNLAMLVAARATSSAFRDEDDSWVQAAARRDQSLEIALEQLKRELTDRR